MSSSLDSECTVLGSYGEIESIPVKQPGCNLRFLAVLRPSGADPLPEAYSKRAKGTGTQGFSDFSQLFKLLVLPFAGQAAVA